jgi:hypothetical protein
MKAVFLRALEEVDKEAALRGAICEPEATRGAIHFEVDPTMFAAVPRSPFAYWVRDDLRELFKKLPPFESDGRTAKQGLATAADFRFVRGWWEIQSGDGRDRWLPFAKGGVFSPFYADVYLVVNWGCGGAEITNFCKPGSDRVASRPQNIEFFLRPGLTWPLRTKSELSVRIMPGGCAFSHKGPAAFVAHDDGLVLLALLATVRGSAFRALVELQLAAADAKPGGAAHSYEVGVIQSTPVPPLGLPDRSALAGLARRAWSLKRSLDTNAETSHAFVLPALLQVEGDFIAAQAGAWAERIEAVGAELAEVQAEIDDRCFELYGIGEADRRAITEGLGGGAGELDVPEHAAGVESDDEGGAEASADAMALAAELVSWAVGVGFGRFDVRLATGDRAVPGEPEPFDPLPVCSPGMLTGEDGLPLASAPAGYPLIFPEDGILVDDPGDSRDLTAVVLGVFEVVFGVSADAFWEEAAALLDPKGNELRAWLVSGFFEHHLKRHSKSRRKAPIVWQLGVPSGRYSVWLYAHRLTGDSLFQLQNDVVAPKVVHEERRLTSLVQSSGNSPSAKERKEIAAQETFVEELRALLEEVKRVAPLWSPTLDDGIVLAMAPLWPLVPQHKSWQRELKSKWDELAAGRYDWAHVAMRLWPERAVPKCATDRSLAIAHGLEDTFWVEGEDGKWEPRAISARTFEELIQERRSTAIPAALEASLDRPDVTAGGRRRATAA